MSAVMPAVERRCFLHVGTHKTGTTSIQAFLAKNRATLARHGVLIPDLAGAGEPDFADHHALSAELLTGRPDRDGALTALIAQLRSTDAIACCLSSENLTFLYDRPSLLGRLYDGIRQSGFTPVVVVFLRSQVSYASAVYAQNVSGGYRAPFATFLEQIIESGGYRWDGGHGPPFDYVNLLDPFATFFGRAAMQVRRFSSDAPDTTLLRSFADIVCPTAAFEGFNIPPKRANRTLTFGAVLDLLGQPNNFHEHLRFAPFGLRDIGRIALRFAPANRRLANEYGLRLPVCEPLDILRALPVRKTPLLTAQLVQARRLLRKPASGPDTRILAN